MGTQVVIHKSASAQQTRQIAADLAQSINAGQCIALDGQLGAGKTQFVRGIVDGLGGDPRQVSSPTFVLLNIYDTPKFPVYHLDAYRVSGADDLEAIGFSELLEQNALVIVEWAQRVIELLPQHRLDITLDILGQHRREIQIKEQR